MAGEGVLALAGWRNVSYRTLSVWRRHFDVWLKLWKTESWPPFVEGVLQLLAFGLGLGYYVADVNGQSYLAFIAPAALGVSAMFGAGFECTFGSYFRMEEQRTFEAIVATPVSVEDVITAEYLWGATRAMFSTLAMLLVISGFGLITSPWAALIPLVALVEALAFGGLAMCFTSMAPSFGFFNYFITLILTPMMLFSGVFFPVSRLPWLVQDVVWISPLFHAANLMRALAAGQLTPALGWDALFLALIAGLACSLSLALMRRRLIV
jgi:lipooligosaccharide transport system permease protein